MGPTRDDFVDVGQNGKRERNALDERGEAFHDAEVAAKCAALGMHVGAMSPDRFAEWLAGVMR